VRDNGTVSTHPTRSSRPRWIGPVYIALALCLVPWIVYLGATLPRSQVSSHYRLAWVGFDIVLFGQLARTGLYAMHSRWSRLVPRHAAASATLLAVDAWFDTVTSTSGALPLALAQAFLVELPLAGLCWWLASRPVGPVADSGGEPGDDAP
jgi:hypothetical protein